MKEPIRILQVFGKMERGGAEAVIMNLFRNVDRRKVVFDFIVHTNDKCAFDDEIYSLGGKIFHLSAYKGVNHFSYKKWWNNFFMHHKEYNLVHGHVRSTAAIFLAIAKKFGLITIAHSHSTSSGKGFPAIVKILLQYPIRNIADYFFACSKKASVWLFGKKTFNSCNSFLLQNAIETSDFIFNPVKRNEKRRILNPEDKFIVGHVGRFDVVKNHTFLIDIFKTFHEKYKNSLLVLIGDGELLLSVKKKVTDLGLTNAVIFTGVRSDVSDLLQAMDVFLLPSLYEGLPVTLIEAQASGLKCIVTDTITDEVKITNLIQFVSLEKSSEYWAMQILEYINGYERKNTSAEIIGAGYDVKGSAQWLQNFYLSVLNPNANQP